MGEKYQSQVRKLIGFSAKNCAKMTKHPERFLKNQVPKKGLTNRAEWLKIKSASSDYTQANDGPSRDLRKFADQGTKALQWFQQYVTTDQPDSTPSLSAQPVRFIYGCAFCSIEIAPPVRGYKKRPAEVFALRSTLNRPYNNHTAKKAGRCLLEASRHFL